MADAQAGSSSTAAGLGERQPLIQPAKKPFLRARPLWLVPFAIVASVTRSMTYAPRIEVYTQLACASTSHPHTQQASNQTLLPQPTPHLPQISNDASVDHVYIQLSQDDPRHLPSPQCVSNPAVQREAARIQTILTISEGLLSALTTGWWGHFSERFGRTRVLAISTLGLFLTDLTFILVATPGSILAAHHHKLLIISPLLEGLLGGWSTLHSAISAYLSDCTSPGSRATIFSRFTGVFFMGFSLGPVLGGWIIAHGIPGIDRIGTVTKEGASVTEVFWLAISMSFINFFLTTFLFPESLTKEQRSKAKATHEADVKGKARATEDIADESCSHEGGSSNFIQRFFSPLALFLPVVVSENTNAGIRKRKDWSLTFLALAMFLHMLMTGIEGVKYLYVVHVYNWAADQLSYFISYLGALRAIGLLFVLPTIISAFKPKPPTSLSAITQPGGKKLKPKPTKARLATEIKFDLLLTQCCIMVDLLSQALIAIIPSPDSVHHMGIAAVQKWIEDPNLRNTALFVAANGFGTLSSGFVPACQSLALCIVQARQLMEEPVRGDGDSAATEQPRKPKPETSTGKLFGALAILQAVGQMILGPLLFGIIYGSTVAYLPKAIFLVGSGIAGACLACALLIRNPVAGYLVTRKAGRRRGRRRFSEDEEHFRGRSTASKDLFGYGSSQGSRVEV